MGKLIAVNYTVPVACFVDLGTNSVVGVAVLDEELRLEGSAFDERGEPVASDSPEAAQARSIAEDEDNIWPRWSFGIEGVIQGPVESSGGSSRDEIELATPPNRRLDETLRWRDWLRRNCYLGRDL